MTDLVTVFGASGFIGRYVVQELAARGARIRAVTRDPHTAQFLKPLTALGQLGYAKARLSSEKEVRTACEGATAVINLVGILDGSDEEFGALHREGARRIAEAAAGAGAASMIHVSAIGADAGLEDGPAYARSKGEGEEAVRKAFADATIVRPSIVFGPEDEFLNRFARLIRVAPIMPIVAPDARFQPVYVNDLAAGISEAALHPDIHGGQTYEVGGPDVVTMRELMHYIARTIGRDISMPEVPDALTGTLSKVFGWMPGAPITHDQYLMLQRPSVVSGPNGLSALGVQPTPVQAVAPNWLVRYRKQGRFTQMA
ncbi:complex I NDUFA9 subunit family protein [Pacificimonas sp. ICDLI1SI03]